jgi:hypothetical protein
MTTLQIYMVIAPLVVLAIGAAGAYWWVHTQHH